jgi:predicted DNA-binding transcriptional regulator AlpA
VLFIGYILPLRNQWVCPYYATMLQFRTHGENDMNIDRLINISEAFPFIGMRKSKIYLEISAGRLQATKVGRSTFLTEAEIARYIAANSQSFGSGAAIIKGDNTPNQPHTA